jgi:flagellar hook assembly protein FlgD
VFRNNLILSINDNQIHQYKLILNQNYPNPFNSNTQITFGVPADSRVAIKIYDVLGREVITLTDRDYSAGYHSVYWKGLNHHGLHVSSGVYIYRMMLKEKSICKKMLLIK